MSDLMTPPSIVVGIDGSKAAESAALWAADEAVNRDIPLTMMYAVGENGDGNDPAAAGRKLEAAEAAIRYALAAVEASDKPVKIEWEITHSTPVSALVRASRSAAMVCVGAMGLNHFSPGRIGSTAAAVAASAHCPVAVVRRSGPARGCVVAQVDNSPESGVVLQAAMAEAVLRDAPLCVVSCWQCGDSHDSEAVADGHRRVQAALDSQLTQWVRRYPHVQVTSTAVHGNPLDFLAADDGPPPQLLVVGARNRGTAARLMDPEANRRLQRADCSVLVVDHQHL